MKVFRNFSLLTFSFLFLAIGHQEVHSASSKLECLIQSTQRAFREDDAKQVLQKTEVQNFRQRYRSFQRVKPEDNKKYLKLMKNDQQGQPDRLFFENENAILKELNDSIIGDKDGVNAIANAYREIFFSKLDANAHLQKELLAKYVDYKSIRLIFNRSTPKTEKELLKIYRETAAEFEQLITQSPFAKLLEGRRGIAVSPSSWHLAGTGNSADQAGLGARSARSRFKPNSSFTRPQAFATISEKLERDTKTIEKLRVDLEKNVALKRSGILTPALSNPNRYILSEDSIEILRKVKASNWDEYVSSLKIKFKKRFGVELREFEVKNIRDYYSLADSFSPGIFTDSLVNMPIQSAQFGIVSVDFAGQGARNLNLVMDGLQTAADKSVQEVVALTRQGYERSTTIMNGMKRQFQATVANQRYPSKQIYFSGDDGIFIPPHLLTIEEKVSLISDLAKSDQTRRLRVTFVPSNYADTGAPIFGDHRSSLIILAEETEKQTKSALDGIMARQKQKEIMIAVDIVPRSTGKGTVNIIVSGNTDARTRAIVEEAAKTSLPNSYQLGKVIVKPNTTRTMLIPLRRPPLPLTIQLPQLAMN